MRRSSLVQEVLALLINFFNLKDSRSFQSTQQVTRFVNQIRRSYCKELMNYITEGNSFKRGQKETKKEIAKDLYRMPLSTLARLLSDVSLLFWLILNYLESY